MTRGSASVVGNHRAPLLTLSAATRVMAALDELHRVCLGMDLERQAERPTEEEYQAAMAEAAAALKGWAPHQRSLAC